jgi:hypothetical protein
MSVTTSKTAHGDYDYQGRTYRYDSAYKSLYVFNESSDAYVYCCGNPYNLNVRKLIKNFSDNDSLYNVDLQQ